MTIELIMTKESDGNWYRVLVNERTKACVKINSGKEIEAQDRANEIFNFYVENKGEMQLIKSVEI